MLPKALRLIRQYHQKTQAELADELSISKEKLALIEASKTPVSADVLQRYSDIFDISIDSLVFFSESIGREGKYAYKVRRVLAGKILDVLEWVNHKNEEAKVKA